MTALEASFLIADHIAKATKPFMIGEELFLAAMKNICHEHFGEDEVIKSIKLRISLLLGKN